jgi:S1-C subfamily serine protease
MRSPDLRRARWSQLLSRFHARVVLLALAGSAALAVAAGFASARPAPIGTGVVVIDTTLAYQGGEAAGTGMVLTSSGEILTNNHLIRGATTIKIVVPGTGHSYAATVVGYSVSADVAVLQARGASNLKTVAVGNSSTLKIGQSVTAVGNAGGTGSLVSTSGTLTGLRRSITVSDDQGGTTSLTGLIETNAALESGDSGGPLLNTAGKVVGMDTAASVSGGFQQISTADGYAIPINKALTIAKRIDSGTASATVHVGATAYLGVVVVPADAAWRYGYTGSSSGAVIAGVASGGPAAKAGLTAGDTITALDGRAVSTSTALSTILLKEKPGVRVTVTYTDSTSASQTTTVTLASGPPQ